MSWAGRTVAAIAVLASLLSAAMERPADSGARARTVCCFFVTIDVEGRAKGDYGASDPRHSDYLEGDYVYSWTGTTYGLARYNGFVLRSDVGVASGDLEEGDLVKPVDFNGQVDTPAKMNACRPSPLFFVSSGNSIGGGTPLARTKPGFPEIKTGLSGTDGLSFGDPYVGVELNCGGYATNVKGPLEAVNNLWDSPQRFFDYFRLSGINARTLRRGGSQKVLCLEHAESVRSGLTATGVYAVYISIKHVASAQAGSYRHKILTKVGKPTLDTPPGNPAERAVTPFEIPDSGLKRADDGCHPYHG